MIKDFNELLSKAQQVGTKKLAVAAAGNEEVLKAVKLSQEKGIIDPILVGDEEKIELQARDVGLKLERIELIEANSKKESCRKAVQMVSSGRADILMKGLVDTSVIMKEVFNSRYGLRTDRLISHIAMVESERLNRIVFVTDGGINIKPDLAEKKEITQNVIDIAQKLGWKKPKVAILGAVEKVNSKMAETLDAAALTKMAERGQISRGIVDGPLAIDNALSEESACIKGIDSPVAGEADILVVPDIVAGNILGKSPIYFADDKLAAIIGGTSRPVVITSRADTALIKTVSVAAAVLTT